MQLYNVPTGIDQQIEDLLTEQLKAEQYKRSQYTSLLRESELRIQRLQAALKGLSN